MLRLYYARRPDTETAALTARLPAWRRETLARLKNEDARRSSLGAGLLWRLVMEENGLDPNAPVRRLGAGKPVLAGGGVWFSLSHSGKLCLCALSDGPVGADIQKPRPAKLSIARRFCADERAYLESLPAAEQNDALMALWARKEAWVKAMSRERMLALDEYSVLAGGAPWLFTDFQVEDCFGSVCAAERAAAPERLEI